MGVSLTVIAPAEVFLPTSKHLRRWLAALTAPAARRIFAM